MVPAYNEERNIEKAIRNYTKAVRSITNDYEIIIFNDGSTDKTEEIADALAKRSPRVRVVHNKKNMGLGYNYREGFRLAKKNYYIMFSGEGEILESSVKSVLNQAGKADIIVPYIGNFKVRPLYRRIISDGFTTLLNLLFGLDLKYYNGYVLHRTKLLKKVRMTTNSFAYQAEILVRLLKSRRGYSYIQVPYRTAKTIGSSCFRIKNLIGVLITVIRLFFDIYLKKNKV